MDSNLAASLRFMAVTADRSPDDRDLVSDIVAAVRGGATSVQLRLKRVAPRDLAAAARAVRAAVSVPLIVNDRLDIALATGADGVHLGPSDFPVSRARRVVPPGFLVGASVGNPDEAAQAGPADYWGVGPWRTTVTKADAGAPIGEAGFRAVVGLAGGRPCVAIGGILAEDGPLVFAAGGAGIAVASGLFAGPDPEAAARRYAERLPV